VKPKALAAEPSGKARPLPCGIMVDPAKDKCCVTICPNPEIGGRVHEKTGKRLDIPPRRQRCDAADACPHWTERKREERRDPERRKWGHS
jgi:hypothetical protein